MSMFYNFQPNLKGMLSALLLLGMSFQLSALNVFPDESGKHPNCFNYSSAISGADLDMADFLTNDCCNGSKPKSITLKYTGQGCSASNNNQGSDKWSCQDFGSGPNGTASVYIVASKNSDGSGSQYFAGTVAINTTFNPTSSSAGESKFPSNVWFNIRTSKSGTLLQRVKIHTSCSAPIVLGDQFGSLVLQGVVFENGTSCTPPPPPSEVCPTPVINVPAGQKCAGTPLVFSAPDLGFPCLKYVWDFGPTASPPVAVGLGPHSVTFGSAGTVSVKLTIDNGCDASGSGSGSNGTSGSSGTAGSNGSSGSSGSNGSTGSSTTGGVICPVGGVGSNGSSGSSGSNGSGSNGSSGSNGNDPCGSSNGSSGSSGSGSGSAGTAGSGNGSGSNSAGTDGSGASGDCNCIECRKTTTVQVVIEPCTAQPGKIGDFVWVDQNSNGIQDAGEPGIPNAFVMLMKCSGAFVNSTFTDATGMYMFGNVPAGSYKIFFANPNGGLYMPTLQKQGGNIALDSDPDNTGFTSCFEIAPGQSNFTIDAGFKPLGPPPCNINLTVSNIVCDGKGTPSTADDTYTFVINVSGTGTGTTWTGGFDNACLGAFGIGPTPYNTPVTLGPFPAGEVSCGNTFPPLTFQNGLNINVSVADSQNPSCTKSTTVQSPGPCSPVPQLASLGDFVWNDLNQNGQQDAGEPGVGGVTVRLFKCDNTFVSQTTTSNVGFYQFTNLVANMQYFVEFSSLPAGFQFTQKDAAADNIDSDANPANGRTDCTFLSPGENDNSIDAGVFQPAPQLGSIGDFVWRDNNQNGIQDPGETGMPGVTVQLKNCSNAVLQTTTTSNTGFYSFNNLPGGCYRVGVVLPAGMQFSPQDQGGNDALDSDVNPATAMTGDINLAPGQNNNTIDAGLFQPAQPTGKIGDYVWRDDNQNGIQDPGEPGVQGALVKLFRCDNSFIGQFSTNAAGFYQFINLGPGSYFLEFSNLPAGFVFTSKDAGFDDTKDSDVNPGTGRTDCFNLAAGQDDPTRDAGIKPGGGTGPATIGDFVWFDTNGNGIQDPGEPGIPNVFVILETCTGAFVKFATTNGQGKYLITNVQPGQYRVKFASPGTFNGSPVQFTTKDAGGDDTKDSDADWLGFTDCFTVNAGETNLTIDAGLTGETPPPVCTINGTVSNVVCNNGQVCFTLVVNGTNTGDWGYDIPALNQFTLQYGQPYNFCIPGSANPTKLLLNDHDVANCHTTVTINSPPPCNQGGPVPGDPCSGIVITPGQGKITVSGLTAPIEIVKVFNTTNWSTVFECTANCSDPTVANVPAGNYLVKVQMFSATWQMLCTKEATVNVSSFTGNNGGGESLGTGEHGTSADEASAESGNSPRVTIPNGQATVSDFNLFPNPAGDFAIVFWGADAEWEQAELALYNQLGQLVKTVEIEDANAVSQQIDLVDLPSGQYFVQVRIEGQTPTVKKLMIKR
jgi:hypothetical protein